MDVYLSFGLQTAQVASQQGKYLGKKLSKIARLSKTVAENAMPGHMSDEAVTSPFQ